MYGGVVVRLTHLTAGKPKTEIPNLPVSPKSINLMKVTTILLGPGRESGSKGTKNGDTKMALDFFLKRAHFS